MRSEEYKRREMIIARAMDILEEKGFEDIDKITDYEERGEELSRLRKETTKQLEREFDKLPKDVAMIAMRRLRGKSRKKSK